jgi:hypothetical protein
MEDAPNPKPVMTEADFTPKITKMPPTPRRPRPATHKPITAPLRKATLRAWLIPPVMAAFAVLTLPFVATFIPKKPARTEKKRSDYIKYSSDPVNSKSNCQKKNQNNYEHRLILPFEKSHGADSDKTGYLLHSVSAFIHLANPCGQAVRED